MACYPSYWNAYYKNATLILYILIHDQEIQNNACKIQFFPDFSDYGAKLLSKSYVQKVG
jgi:hypothetical protein